MRKSIVWIARILTLTTVSFLVACGGTEPAREDQQTTAFADLRLAVSETVSDDGRRIDVLAIVDSLEKEVDELRTHLIRRRGQLRELNANYDTTREEMILFSSQMETRIQRGRRQALEQHQQLVAALTAGEWESLAKAETRAMKAIAESVRGI